ncbi:MAG: proline--tRNA ligase [Candidatus Marinimicrobia bacterium]|nr:proline--tRNA ligase [Candidatus Neomarinimicrobiota bacterium]|tara:strand:- start:3158 stop:4627 length:1470 start_codon:yes stop_codon:yes gene_type:complete
MSKGITQKSEDHSKWYTDVITKAQLADYGPVKGTMVIKPYGFAIWELVKDEFDKQFKATGHQNAYFPLFIPKSFLAKEADHVEGFAKECAIVTHSRLMSDEDNSIKVDPSSKLEEEIIVRPTSETVIWHMYKKWINSYRDLPILINQWANVVRWEMRTRLFLRTSEFLWQEGHTAHSTESEAREETLKILDIYESVSKNHLAIPVLTGKKSESEKFAGAVDTYCIEAMMGDKRALQAGTSHYLGQNFAKAFDVKFQTDSNTEEYVYASSWGVSTRLIGAIIMVHGDDNGLRLPPSIAPTQVVIVPFFKNDEEINNIKKYIDPYLKELESKGIRILLDDREKISPGFKFNEWELKGVPVRIEIGAKEIESNQLTIFRRDINQKEKTPINTLTNYIQDMLDQIQQNLFQQADKFRKENTFTVDSYEEFKTVINKGGFVRCGWDGTEITEKHIKDETKATIRCIPFDESPENKQCIFSGKDALHEAIFAKAY